MMVLSDDKFVKKTRKDESFDEICSPIANEYFMGIFDDLKKRFPEDYPEKILKVCTRIGGRAIAYHHYYKKFGDDAIPNMIGIKGMLYYEMKRREKTTMDFSILKTADEIQLSPDDEPKEPVLGDKDEEVGV